MQTLIRSFVDDIASGVVELDSEKNLQMEFGLFLRTSAGIFNRVHFEKNVSSFGFDKKGFVKKEIDIALINAEKKPLIAIELKYPGNGRYPDTMFDFCKDICFLEQLKRAGFQRAFLLLLASDPLFYSGLDAGIYGYFRREKPLHGPIEFPTGRKNGMVPPPVHVSGSYTVVWQPIKDRLKYALIEAT